MNLAKASHINILNSLLMAMYHGLPRCKERQTKVKRPETHFRFKDTFILADQSRCDPIVEASC